MNGKMLNFTVGPVTMPDSIIEKCGEQLPYFRTPEFSEVMKKNEALLCAAAFAPAGSRAVFLTGSGTCSMEAAVMNLLAPGRDRALVVCGGSFGERFARLCELHKIEHTRITLAPGESLTEEHISVYSGKGYTALLVNICETSTGVLYDMEMLGRFCKRENIFLIGDAISAFIADDISMEKCGIGALTVGSQKALSLAPGLSAIVLSPAALERVAQSQTVCMYMDLKAALADGERGQTPFTPAVGLLLLLCDRLSSPSLCPASGSLPETADIAALARYFRDGLERSGLPLRLLPQSPSNSVTALVCSHGEAYEVFSLAKERGIWVCPNGGGLKTEVFRVGHLGALKKADYDFLLSVLGDIYKTLEKRWKA